MKLEVSQEQLNVILNALATQPYIQVAELIHELQRQGQSQLQVLEDTPEADTAKAG